MMNLRVKKKVGIISLVSALMVAVGVFLVLEKDKITQLGWRSGESYVMDVGDSTKTAITWEVKSKIAAIQMEEEVNERVIGEIMQELGYEEGEAVLRVLGTNQVIIPAKISVSFIDLKDNDERIGSLAYPTRSGGSYFCGMRFTASGQELSWELYISSQMMGEDNAGWERMMSDLIVQALVYASYTDKDVVMQEANERIGEFYRRYLLNNQDSLIRLKGDGFSSFKFWERLTDKLVKRAYAGCEGLVQCGTGETYYKCSDGSDCPATNYRLLCDPKCLVPLDAYGECPEGQDNICGREATCTFEEPGPCPDTADATYCKYGNFCFSGTTCVVAGTECQWIYPPPPPPGCSGTCCPTDGVTICDTPLGGTACGAGFSCCTSCSVPSTDIPTFDPPKRPVSFKTFLFWDRNRDNQFSIGDEYLPDSLVNTGSLKVHVNTDVNVGGENDYDYSFNTVRDDNGWKQINVIDDGAYRDVRPDGCAEGDWSCYVREWIWKDCTVVDNENVSIACGYWSQAKSSGGIGTDCDVEAVCTSGSDGGSLLTGNNAGTKIIANSHWGRTRLLSTPSGRGSFSDL